MILNLITDMHSDKLHKFIWLLKNCSLCSRLTVEHSNKKIKFYIPVYIYMNK